MVPEWTVRQRRRPWAAFGNESAGERRDRELASSGKGRTISFRGIPRTVLPYRAGGRAKGVSGIPPGNAQPAPFDGRRVFAGWSRRASAEVGEPCQGLAQSADIPSRDDWETEGPFGLSKHVKLKCSHALHMRLERIAEYANGSWIGSLPGDGGVRPRG